MAQNSVPDISKLSLSSTGATAKHTHEQSLECTAPSSDDSRTPAEAMSSPMSSLHSATRRFQPPINPNPLLTESALSELNAAASVRKGKPSSTGGTTANTRPTEVPDMPELSDVPEADELESAETVGSTGADILASTPPPMADHLPVVSLQDIAVMEQKQGRRGRRVRSRRGSTTASHTSLSAIPENLEITPLHARSERSDSMRVTMAPHLGTRLAEVQELDVCFLSLRLNEGLLTM
jgi:hypothetical protein